MDSSRRAVESYWRSRMIDGATSDEDKVTPVYKLEEICEMLRSSHVGIVKEVSEFILKRIDHKSPIVKQKALRLIKYAVGKSGVEFRREMQRHSAAVRQLLHYKGQLDPLKGDSLNKAVRDTAQEALSALFASEDNKPAPTEELSRRIEGFGNTNSEMPSEDKKSFLSEVVGLGSASIKQGLSSISAAHSLRNNGSGSYKGPNLRSSLTKEIENADRYERVEHYRETQGSSGIPKDVASGPWNRDSRVNMLDTANADSSSSYTKNKSREERLVETIVTSGGVRLQPTRDAIQVFLVEASKLDTIELSHALESKLQSHLWQVRMKAVCVLESILRKKNDAHFSTVASYFSENKDAVVRCSESPQASLSEKANKVLSLLDGEHTTGARSHSQKTTAVRSETDTIVMPDLIDTGEPYDYDRKDDSTHTQNGQGSTNLMTPSAPAVIDDLFGDSLITGVSTTTHNNEEDPFADVSFHTKMDREQTDDLFSGLTIDDKHPIEEYHMPVNKVGEEVFDIFGPSSELLHNQDMNDLMAGLSINENASPLPEAGSISGTLSESIFADQKLTHRVSNNALNGIIGSQIFGTGPNTMPPSSSMQYSIPPNIIFNPAFASQNYPPMGNFIAQQQLLATVSNFQNFGNINTQGNAGFEYAAGQSKEGGYSSPFPDIFNPHIPSQPQSTILNSSKKEETKAFDFISEHLSAARDPKRVV